MTARILVVDDEPDLEALIVQRFRRQIRDGQFSFVFAHDGISALALLEGEHGIDMVVSDINMPRMDGLTLLARLQERDDRLEVANKQFGTRICVGDSVAVRIPGFQGRPVGDLILRGRSEALRAYEPLTADRYAHELTADYLMAFGKAQTGDPGAMPAFAALLGRNSEDGMVGFHLKRLLNGVAGISVALD